MRKILFVLPSITQTNGIASFLFNYLTHFSNCDGVEILTSDIRPSKLYIDIADKHNIPIYFFPNIGENGYIKYKLFIEHFFNNHHDYEIVYSNSGNQSFLILKIAMKYGVKIRAIHSHATSSGETLIKRMRNNILQKLGMNYATHFLACSSASGKSFFGKIRKFDVVYNAIDYNEYKFSPSARCVIRNRLNIEDESILIGFVGRLVKQKNPLFLVKIAAQIKRPFKILIIGFGSLKEEMIYQISKAKLNDFFIFIDECNNVKDYYSAMDIFLLPSFYEGLPVVGIEAQANGLHCIFSSNISKEVKISNLCEFLSLDDYNIWSNYINELDCQRKVFSLVDQYDIDIQSKKFENLLLDLKL